VGSLIFYVGIIPLFFFRVKVSTDIFAIVIFLLNLINNGVIVYGLFWNKPEEVKT
jgi:hypothetical protein